MRIALSGSHRVGKSTLLDALAEALPSYATFDEPYDLLEEEGHAFADPPALEDFEAQLARSIELLGEGGADALFDRCPVDFLAYLGAHPEADAFDTGPWLPRVRAALRSLDLVVYVPVETARVVLPSHEDPALREEVDERIRALLLDDDLDLGLEVLEVGGTTAVRTRQVLRRVAG
jgi:hypothetical protein